MKRTGSTLTTRPKRKRARIYGPPRTLALKSHIFRRSDYRTGLFNPFNGVSFHANNNPAPLSTSGYFVLNGLANYTELVDLFDQYRIVWIRMKIYWNHPTDQMNLSAASLTSVPLLSVIKDSNDGVVPASIASMIQNETFQTHLMTRPYIISFRPKCAQALYAGAISTGYGEQGNPWIETNSPSVQYYGMKWAVDPNGATVNFNAGQITVVSDVWVECRDVK